MTTRTDKLNKLVAVFDAWHAAIAELAEPMASSLHANWIHVRPAYTDDLIAARGQLASGMEQGLRELPLIIASFTPTNRSTASLALRAALLAHFPDFILRQQTELDRIKAARRIRGEKQFHAARHHIDVLEARQPGSSELKFWYDLVDRFEASH